MNNDNFKDKKDAYGKLSNIDAFEFYSTESFDQNTLKELKRLKKRHWLYIVYPESAPSDWMEMLKQTGLQFAVSPLHDKDVDVAGNLKKPHWHVIVSFEGPTTFNTASSYCEVTKGPYPKVCENVRGSYEYFTHKNDADKYQYLPAEIKEFNGFQVDISKKEVLRIKKELSQLIFNEDITEIMEFDVMVRMLYGDEYYEVASSCTYYFNALIKSLHHNPKAVENRMVKINKQINDNNELIQEENSYESNCEELGD